jgi:hypothetical protein
MLILRLVFTLAFLYLAARVNAGSAVAWDGDRHLVTSFGHPVEVAKARALADARFNGWANAKIIGSSDVTGYGAVAVARHPNGVGALIGVSLGNRSQSQATAKAIELCRKAGGTDVRIKYSFQG